MLLVGHGPRTTRESLDYLSALMPDLLDEILGIELASWRINLDGVLVPVSADVAVVHPDSIESAVRIDGDGTRSVDVLGLLREHGMSFVEITAEEAKREGCNCLCLGDRTVVAYEHNTRVVAELRRHEIEVVTVPGLELLKGTGGPRCMSRPVYGELVAQRQDRPPSSRELADDEPHGPRVPEQWAERQGGGRAGGSSGRSSMRRAR